MFSVKIASTSVTAFAAGVLLILALRRQKLRVGYETVSTSIEPTSESLESTCMIYRLHVIGADMNLFVWTPHHSSRPAYTI